MTELLHFMAESPWFSFFVLFLICGTIIQVSRYIAYAIRGDPEILKNEKLFNANTNNNDDES